MDWCQVVTFSLTTTDCSRPSTQSMICTLLNLHYFRKGIYHKSLQLNYSYWGLLFWVPPTPPFLTVQTHAPPHLCTPQSVNLKFLLLLHNSVFALESCVNWHGVQMRLTLLIMMRSGVFLSMMTSMYQCPLQLISPEELVSSQWKKGSFLLFGGELNFE